MILTVFCQKKIEKIISDIQYHHTTLTYNIDIQYAESATHLTF